MKQLIPIILLIILPIIALSQDFIYPGESRTVTAENDTLYVINKSQMRQMVKTKQKNEILRELNNNYEEKICTLESKTAELDSLANIHEDDAIYYRRQWEAAEKDLSKAAKEARRQHRLKILAGIGGTAVGIVIGLLF